MKTKRVRIAVAINSAGEYLAGGGYRADRDILADELLNDVRCNYHGGTNITLYWIEADVPIPSAKAAKPIKGKVKR